MRVASRSVRLVLILGLLIASTVSPRQVLAQAANLKILVIEGEGAVNIIQQKTAVAPVIEVRDRNNQPVAGASVRFVIQSGRASFNGSRTLTLTTNAAGRATATGFSATSSGALKISASAAFQGQSAAVTIAQTNVLTAAQAAQATAAAASTSGGTTSAGGAAGAAGGASGGGLSTVTTLSIVGGVAAGGTLVVTQAVLPQGTKYAGDYSGGWDFNITSVNPPGTCRSPMTVQQTLTIQLEEDAGAVHGQARSEGTESSVGCSGQAFTNENSWEGADVSGTTVNITFTYVDNYPQPNPGDNLTATYVFTGTLSGDAITGTLTRTDRQTGSNFNGFGQIAMPVTLHAQ